MVAEKTDILFHKETPGAQLLLSLLKNHTVRQFSEFSEAENHSGLIIAGFQQFSHIPQPCLQRALVVGQSSEVHLLRDEQWFQKGLCDAQLLPINEVLFSAKIDQLVFRTRQLYIEEIIRKVQEHYKGGLSPKEIGILYALLRNGQRGVSRQQFGDGVWSGLSVHSKTLDTHLFNLRSKLEEFNLNIVWHREQQVWRLHSANPKVRLD